MPWFLLFHDGLYLNNVKWQEAVLALAIIGIIGLAIYSNTFHSPFVFDDVGGIVENVDMDQENIPWSSWHSTRGISHLTFYINFHVSKLNVVHWHIVNLIIHLVTAGVAFFLSYYLASVAIPPTAYRWGRITFTNHVALGLLVGVLFVAHPIQTQAVTYISQRLASLATLFYLLTLLGYVKFRLGRRGYLWAGLSLLAGFLAMHSKEFSITIPAAIVLLEYSFFSTDWRRLLRRLPFLVPWLLLSLIIPYYLLGGMGRLTGGALFTMPDLEEVSRVTTGTRDISRGTYFLTQVSVVRTYLRLLVLPVRQNLDYDYPLVDTVWRLPTVASLLLHLALLGSAVWLYRRRQRLPAFGIVLFYLTLLPTSSVVPFKDVIFEHRVYVAFIGFALVVGSLGVWLMNKVGRRQVMMVVIVLLLASLAVATWRRNVVWQDDAMLWEDVVAKSPAKVRPRKNLASIYTIRGRLDEAEEHLQVALEQSPTDKGLHSNLGVIYHSRGQLDKAAVEYQKEKDLYPGNGSAYLNMSHIYVLQGRWAEAEAELQRALAIQPQLWGARNNLGLIYLEQGRVEEARVQFKLELEINPRNEEARLSLEEIGY